MAIISRETIRARARSAFEQGKGRNDHDMNWHAPAVVDWQAEWDRLAAAKSQKSHTAPAGRARVELAQEVV